MYFTNLRTTNVRLLADQQLNFTRDGQPRMWTVLLGDNGTCKTTTLQLLAAASNGQTLANVWLADPRVLVGPNKSGALFEAEIVLQPDVVQAVSQQLGIGGRVVREHDTSPREHQTDLSMQRRPSRPANCRPLLHVQEGYYALEGSPHAHFALEQVRSRRLSGAFQCGYGVSRRLSKPAEPSPLDNPARERSGSLFDRSYVVRGLNFSSTIAKEFGDEGLANYFGALTGALFAVFPDDGHLPLRQTAYTAKRDGRPEPVHHDLQFQLQSSPRGFVAADQLSDGYQCTLAWIADLIGQYALDAGKVVPPAEMIGVVLLDEIDLHLHPSWQRRIVPILKGVFPKLQFIVTTHSPLVLTGFEADEIIHLEFGADGLVHANQNHLEPGLLSGNMLYDKFFGVPHQGRPELVEKDRRYRNLLGRDERTAEEEGEFQRLRYELRPYLLGLR